jgi:hypothetical protein
LRSALNAILAFIGATSLIDEEFDSIELDDLNDDVATYNALKSVLDSRQSLSTELDRLGFYFKAKGAEIDTTVSSKSNIFVGGVL